MDGLQHIRLARAIGTVQEIDFRGELDERIRVRAKRFQANLEQTHLVR